MLIAITSLKKQILISLLSRKGFIFQLELKTKFIRFIIKQKALIDIKGLKRHLRRYLIIFISLEYKNISKTILLNIIFILK